MHGILIIDKPAGITSHDAVEAIRGNPLIAKAGHTGTLDPQATGVLVVCTGQSTRLTRFLIGLDKVYRAELALGEVTTTQDAWGETIEKREKFAIPKTRIADLLQEFTGRIEQLPPMFSAIKKNGRPLYELAREGKEIEREPRAVTIHRLELVDCPQLVDDKRDSFTFRAHVSSGTYIRTLCHDIGSRLGTGGHMRALNREAVGSFTLNEAVSLQVARRVRELSELGPAFLKPDQVLSRLGFPRVTVDERYRKRAENGNVIKSGWCHATQEEFTDGEFLRVHSKDETLLSVSQVVREGSNQDVLYKPVVVLAGR